eukprot:5163048-Amphidinium_carterae.1
MDLLRKDDRCCVDIPGCGVWSIQFHPPSSMFVGGQAGRSRADEAADAGGRNYKKPWLDNLPAKGKDDGKGKGYSLSATSEAATIPIWCPPS